MEMGIRLTMICGRCGAECQSLRTVSWTNKGVCERCGLGRMYGFVKFIQRSKPPYLIRRIIAFMTELLFGGNTCARCGLKWQFGRHHVDYEDGSGSSILCEACFEELPLDVKLAYYRAHWQIGKNECGPHVKDRELYQYTGWTEDDWNESWNRIEDAVTREHRLIPFRRRS